MSWGKSIQNIGVVLYQQLNKDMQLTVEPTIGQILKNDYEVKDIKIYTKKVMFEKIEFYTLFLQKGEEKRTAEFCKRRMIVESFDTFHTSSGSKSSHKAYKSW